MTFLGAKNAAGIRRLCEEAQIPAEKAEILAALVGVYGSMDEVLKKWDDLAVPGARAAQEELRQVRDVLTACGWGSRVRFDFSVVNDMAYYNGIVFKGYVAGVHAGVLSGGQYDKLMRKMGKKSGAVGFAVYLDLLEQLDMAAGAKADCDADVLLLYGESDAACDVAAKVRAYAAEGKRVVASKAVPPQLTFGEVVRMGGEEA